jgi:hypothetical protein
LGRFAQCVGAEAAIPQYAAVAPDGRVVDKSGQLLLFDVSTRAWLHFARGRALTDDEFLGRATRDCQAEMSTQRGVRTIGCDAAPDPPPGSIMGGDGNWYNPYGQQLGYCSSCNGGRGAWVPIIGSTAANPAYDPSLQPYVTAGQFADDIEPWFYGFAMPLDIPVGGLVGKIGGRLLGRIGARLLGAYLSKLAAAAGEENVVRISADWLNANLPGVAAETPPFVPGTQAVQFVVNDGFNQAFQGADQLVRVTADGGNPSGSWWTTLSQISNPDGSLMSAAQIQDVLALPNTPTTIYYGGSVTNGSTGYMGLVNLNFGQGGGAIQFWFDSGSVSIIGSAGLGP